jgi:hypothetical protein
VFSNRAASSASAKWSILRTVSFGGGSTESDYYVRRSD